MQDSANQTWEFSPYFPEEKADLFSSFLTELENTTDFFLTWVITFLRIKKLIKFLVLLFIRAYKWASSQVFFTDLRLIMNDSKVTIMTSYTPAMVPRRRRLILVFCPFFTFPSFLLWWKNCWLLFLFKSPPDHFLLFALTCLFLPFIQTGCCNTSQTTWNCEKWIHAVSHLSAQFLNKRKSKQKLFFKWKKSWIN